MMYQKTEGTIPAFTEFTCQICHQGVSLCQYETDDPYVAWMEENHVCTRCASWLNIIKNRPYNSYVINGSFYIVGPYIKRPYNTVTGGSEGKEFYILKPDWTLLKSNNVTCKGKIPEALRPQLPNTATFISLCAYMKLQKDPFKCKSKGCWNRYHCLRYDLSCEADGPFNKIPEGYVIGSDGCPSFINKDNL